MRVYLSGSKHFGGAAFHLLRGMGCDVVGVSVPDATDRLAWEARAVGVPVAKWGGMADGLSAAVDLVVTAHSWEIVPASVLAACHHGGIGYHPSLLPRHPGRHAVEDTIAAGDTVAGGSVYRLTERIDGGPVLARDSVPVLPGETAAGLWRRALSPMGLALLARVVLDLRLGRHETEPEFDGVGVA